MYFLFCWEKITLLYLKDLNENLINDDNVLSDYDNVVKENVYNAILIKNVKNFFSLWLINRLMKKSLDL